MEKSLSLDGFRKWLEKAVRIEEDKDWSAHTIDYGLFKQRLRYFARRRSRIRSMLRESQDGKIAEDVLTMILGIGPRTPFPSPTSDPKQQEVHIVDAVGGNYVAFIDNESSSSDMDSQCSTKPHRRNKRKAMRRVSNLERSELVVFLQWEMDKAHMFYLAQWQRLSQRLEAHQQHFETLDHDLGDEILELMAFCVINIVTVRQILIRYDMYARTFEGTPMLSYYMKQVTKHPTSFRKILHHEELTAIASTYMELVDSVPIKVHFESQRSMFWDILLSSESAQSIASTGHENLRDSFIHTMRDWIMVGAFEDRLGLEPAYLTMRGKSLTAEMQQLAEWRKKKHEILPAQKVQRQLTGMQVFHLTLNLLSAFLYCMNYYIVEPSSTMYVNRLGAHDAMSGTLIGMMPLAAFVSSLPFSMWTNRSFRHPFIMSCCLLVTGNLLYSFADHFGVVSVALAGRFIAGLGAPKCIIRRYMADTTPISLRTSVNAGFGMVVAAGSAMGPAMAIILNQVEETVGIPYIGAISLNGLTLPGYFMACLWITFTVIVLLTFEEPNREGLEEQKRLESEGRLPGSPQTTPDSSNHEEREDDLRTIFSSESETLGSVFRHSFDSQGSSSAFDNDELRSSNSGGLAPRRWPWVRKVRRFLELITVPVRLCLGLLFAKVFTIEALVSATSALSKNRYHWQVTQVGTLGLVNGLLVIPFSIVVGRLSMSYQDHVLMRCLVCMGLFGFFLLIDLSDLVATPTPHYNINHPLAVGPHRYIVGYFLAYLSIQCFEGVIGSTLSKVIPTALASGTLNSGLLATLVDTFGRSCGDLFISLCGFINLRQLMNLLFVPGFFIMLTCLVCIERFRDLLAV